MPPLPAPRLLVFDLDGTLIDSRTDLANSVNAMLTHFERPTLEDATIASYIGDGAAALVRRALTRAHLIEEDPTPADQRLFDRALHWFVVYYRAHKLDHTTLYPGVAESLALIRRLHPALPMAVLTNKPVRPSREICSHFGFDLLFFQVYGGDSFPTRKPDPAGLQALLAEAAALLGSPLNPSDAVLIGDSAVDIQTARAAGARSLGCTFGLAPDSLAAAHPDFTVDSAFDWPQALGLA